MTRVRVSPLGVTRRATPAAPKATRLIPLGLGLLLLAVFALAGHPYSRGASSTYAPTIVAAFILIIVGIVVAGPWLTRAFTRLLAIRSARPATLIASPRSGGVGHPHRWRASRRPGRRGCFAASGCV